MFPRDQQASAQYVALLGFLFPRPRLKSHRCYLSRTGTLRHPVENSTLKSVRSELCQVLGQIFFLMKKKDYCPRWRKAVYSRSRSETCCYVCLKLFNDGRWVPFKSHPCAEMRGVFKKKLQKIRIVSVGNFRSERSQVPFVHRPLSVISSPRCLSKLFCYCSSKVPTGDHYGYIKENIWITHDIPRPSGWAYLWFI